MQGISAPSCHNGADDDIIQLSKKDEKGGAAVDEEIVIIMEYMDAMKTLCAVNDGDSALVYAYAAASGGRCRLHDAALHTW